MASGVIPLDWHADVVQAAEEETNNMSFPEEVQMQEPDVLEAPDSPDNPVMQLMGDADGDGHEVGT
jgi:hypothetical protein